MSKVLTVIGTRPQFIKAAAVSRAINEHGGIKEVMLHTGQHYDDVMSDIFFREMEIPKPDYHFSINTSTHATMTAQMLEGIEQAILKEKPDSILVYGDTNSTLAGALAASKLHMPVAHVEAGLRSFNMDMPEEVNRILTDRVSTQLFCPTEIAMQNLKNEGLASQDKTVVNTGDVMYDAALYYAKQVAQRSSILQQLGISTDKYLLVTVHRAENTDDKNRLTKIVNAINLLAKQYTVVLPLHPRTKKMIEQYHLQLECMVIEPVGYFDMLSLLQHCHLVLTDSGGLQKEAYFFHKYCVTLRDQTEWVELTKAGCSTITGADEDKIMQAVADMYDKPFKNGSVFYGDGNASAIIAKHLASY
ncbi:UDP-N-acetylglucosamine 2-epimerase (non-hydrolyzing) [Chitinophagaceae bacterium IBVUCB1]|nr:UDP-N-acetylglucosamine 2-epimerase (non-hydrolyzing) [Chitinophagaceae bacterium IBVUCB1]